MSDNNSRGVTFTLGILTILATIISSIPSFMNLTKNRAVLYYQTQEFSILNSSSPYYQSVLDVLRDNQIADSRINIKIKNMGDVAANEVLVGINVDGNIREVLTVPSKKDEPIWVDVPKDTIYTSANISNLRLPYKKFAPLKVLSIDVGYFSINNSKNNSNIDVYFDGKPAVLMDDISEAKKISTLSLFKVPLTILGIGILVLIVASIIIVIINNEQLASQILEFLFRVIAEAAKPLF